MTRALPEDGIIDMIAIDAAVNGLRKVALTPCEQELVNAIKAAKQASGGQDKARTPTLAVALTILQRSRFRPRRAKRGAK